MKKIFITISIIFLLLPVFSAAQEAQPVYLTIFYGEGCPHCAREMVFLAALQKEFPNLKIRKLEIWYNPDNAKHIGEVAKVLNISAASIPLTIIGQDSIVGYLDDQTTGERIRNIVKNHTTDGCADTVGEILGEKAAAGQQNCEENKEPLKVSLPFWGEIDAKTWSLPLLTVIIAALDSLNPCAMWVLLFLISLLFNLENRLKMWLLGGAFLFASAFSYFLFLSAWLNLFLFVGFIYWLRTGVGIFAVLSGVFYLRQYYRERKGGCHATNEDQRKKIMDRLKEITRQEKTWLALLGIIALGFVVNLIELVCSAGLPAIYTQVLALAKLNPAVYYLYLLLYVFIYILPGLIVFIIAMVTLRAFGLSGKFGRWSNLFGGLIILVLGILLIFKPAWIMFG